MMRSSVALMRPPRLNASSTDRAAQKLVLGAKENYPDTRVTVLLSRRTYLPLQGRLLHDRIADKMARAVSRVQGATPIIVPYDIGSRIARIAPDGIEERSLQPSSARSLTARSRNHFLGRLAALPCSGPCRCGINLWHSRISENELAPLSKLVSYRTGSGGVEPARLNNNWRWDPP